MSLLKKELWFLSGILLFAIKVPSQELNVGDYFNREAFISNYKIVPVKQQLKGKWIVLDFWSHTCIVCLKSFPELENFQNKFDDRIQIVLVNRESKDSTETFFAKRTKLYRPKLPFISGDSVLYKRFPHTGVPYHVWIDETDTVRYVNYGDKTNEEKIVQLLNKQFANVVSVKNVKTISSLFDTSFLSTLNYFAYLARCAEGYNLESEKRMGYDQICLKCASISELYTEAFNESKKYNLKKPGRVIIESVDKSRYSRPGNKNEMETWLKANAYNYHLLVPELIKGDKYKIMKEDLERYFKLNARIEKRKIKSLVLLRTSGINKLQSKGGQPVDNFYYADVNSPKNDSIRYLKNISYSTFSQKFENYIEFDMGKPFFDRTSLSGNVDIQIPGAVIDALDYALLRGELRRYDLDLVEMDVEVDVLILGDGLVKGAAKPAPL